MTKHTSIPKVATAITVVGVLLAVLYVVISPNFQKEPKKAQESVPADTQSTTTTATTPSSIDPGPADSASTPKPALSLSETYKAYLFERTLCKRLASLVSKHDQLPKILYDRLYKEMRSEYIDLLFDGHLKDTEEIQYLRTHREYFDIDRAFHGGPGFVYLTGNDGIYCVQRDKRVKELESWGPSTMAWTARQDMLNANRDHLSLPGNETSYGVPFDVLDNMFTEAKKLYVRQDDRVLLIRWVQETEKYLLGIGDKYATDGSAGLTRAQQLEMLREWVSRLRKGLM